MKPPRVCTLVAIVLYSLPSFAAERILDKKLHHLRVDGAREWSDFPEAAEAAAWTVDFAAQPNPREYTLRLRQQDIKQTWQITLNGKPVGKLNRDENDMVVYFSLEAGMLAAGHNSMRIQQVGSSVDDIRVGDVRLYDEPRRRVLNRGSVVVEVREKTSGATDLLPARITIIDAQGALHMVGGTSNHSMAIRPGIVYCNGRAKFGLPHGRFTLTAGRGFEYGIATHQVAVTATDAVDAPQMIEMAISREVPTADYVSCDTHVHTLTHSRHGDSTIDERMLTIAAEGIELPIATDHNIHIDYRPLANQMGLSRYFTPVIGNEVTTKIGHFNVFPIQAGAPVPNFRLTDWKSIFESIYATPHVKAVILNHGRDIHGGYRPFDPKHHNSVTAENLDGWKLKANAMELINSGATQSDPLQLYRDWFALLNRGLQITPVGSSDSHDVGRHFVGQGRTYIQVPDGDAGNIDVGRAVDSFVNGRVLVSYGLLTELTVNGKHRSGDVVSTKRDLQVDVTVKGPGWTTAEQVTLYANGRRIQETQIENGGQPGIKWSGVWTVKNPHHDFYLVAVAQGPGVQQLYWPTAKAYQPTSPDWQSYVIGSTSAVWIDGDADGRRSSAYDYAQRLVQESGGDFDKLLSLLEDYDPAVAAQAAGLIQASGSRLTEPSWIARLKSAAPSVQLGFREFSAAWRESQIARSR